MAPIEGSFAKGVGALERVAWEGKSRRRRAAPSTTLRAVPLPQWGRIENLDAPPLGELAAKRTEGAYPVTSNARRALARSFSLSRL